MAQKLWDFWLKNSGIARRNSGILHRPSHWNVTPYSGAHATR